MLGNGLSRLIHGMILAVYFYDFHFKVVKAKIFMYLLKIVSLLAYIKY